MLGYVNRRHVTIRKLEASITDMVKAYSKLPLPRVWGTGGLAAAEGTKVDLYENSLISEYHIRYGGYGGIAYHHVADSYVALFTHFFACGVWEFVVSSMKCTDVMHQNFVGDICLTFVLLSQISLLPYDHTI
jgi:TnpA family transposase